MRLLSLLFGGILGCTGSTSAPQTEVRPRPSGGVGAAEQADGAVEAVSADDKENQPPEIKEISFYPEQPTAADTISLTVDASDPDGEPISIRPTWFVNGEEVPSAAGMELSNNYFKKKDKVRASVRVSDGTAEIVRESNDLVIANRPPVMDPNSGVVSSLDGAQFRATDPDEDPITWRLEGEPRGMRIEPNGTVRYQGAAEEPGGSYTVAIIADDGDGGFSRLEFPINIQAGSKAGQ